MTRDGEAHLEIFIPYFTLVLAIIGCLVYALSTNPKAAELGRCLFWVALLVWLLKISGVRV